ncbi:MAG: hypothetical protein AAGF67_13905, partial [Verrucomicrobiota bacterium]
MKPFSLFPLLLTILISTSSSFGQNGAPVLAQAGEDGVAAPEAAESAPAAEEKLDFVARSESVVDRILSNSRQVDPFGMAMDPTNMVETSRLADQYSELDETPVMTNSALKNALETLPITGIYPEQHTIVLG